MSSTEPRKTRAHRYIERRIGRPIEKALYEMYVVDRMTLAEIASEWGTGVSTISLWLRTFGIEARAIGHRKPRSTDPRMTGATAAA